MPFISDALGRRWTLYSPDYTAMFALASQRQVVGVYFAGAPVMGAADS